jgi:gamma-glutamylcyclotransferase (GGCT)/AIG2-like uncharacterized protein YtfP
MTSNILYFAYGSNLNAADLHLWCNRKGCAYPLGEKFASAYLPDMELVFNYASPERDGGVLNIRHRLGQATPGVLFQIPSGDFSALDKKESAPHVYKQLQVTALTEDGRAHDAIAYQVHPNLTEGGFIAPDYDYLHVVMDGLAFHGIDDRMLKAAAKGKDAPWTIDRLFVYGTLMEGEPRHHLLESWGAPVYEKEAHTPGLLYDSGKGYPCMAPAEADDQIITGELYQIQDIRHAFEMLDIVEGVRGYESRISLFRRGIVLVTTADGVRYPAWVYLYDKEIRTLSRIKSGSWRLENRKG